MLQYQPLHTVAQNRFAYEDQHGAPWTVKNLVVRARKMGLHYTTFGCVQFQHHCSTQLQSGSMQSAPADVGEANLIT